MFMFMLDLPGSALRRAFTSGALLRCVGRKPTPSVPFYGKWGLLCLYSSMASDTGPTVGEQIVIPVEASSTAAIWKLEEEMPTHVFETPAVLWFDRAVQWRGKN
ncbi:unnamed protein product [Macrosiphum euphorbiae]|uniref:Uncharacterized protein n=1 Tax=Macrosiphum euphorbiae TaxID=13131 RepID=A0AAV0WJH4_9HEMI|nr:unnamed protein product [Macrosiphum euphorbiae]